MPSAPAATYGNTAVFTPPGSGIADGCVQGARPPGGVLEAGQPQLVPFTDDFV